MGCCNIKPYELEVVSEVLKEDSVEYQLENAGLAPGVSFADISLRSKEDENKNITKPENIKSIETQRPRSSSCNTQLFCNNIETAFLMTTPNKVHLNVSSSYNFCSRGQSTGLFSLPLTPHPTKRRDLS